jgi:nitrate/nitrite transport system substrate-binding protein
VGLAQTKRGPEQFHVFHKFQANFPWRSQARWLLQQMSRWHQLPGAVDIDAVVARVYRSDLHRQILADLHSLPTVDEKTEGQHAHGWTLPGTRGEVELGPDRFIDGAIFVPAGS